MRGTTTIALWTAAAALAGCSSSFFDRFCDEPGCEFSKVEWDNLSSLSNLPPPPPDPANKYVGDPRAETLGHQFYFDTRFSGAVTEADIFGRPMPFQGRAPKGQQAKIACATCHDLRHGSVDPSPFPGDVSVGVGLYDVNAQPTINSAYYNLHYWNGRYDSLVWQIVSVGESAVSMGGNRVKTAWIISDLYKDSYSAIFAADYPLPAFGRSHDEQAALLQPDGTCTLPSGSTSCPSWCVPGTSVSGVGACWPRFPLEGKPGKKAGCQRGDPAEPFGDAYDCMTKADQDAITRAYVNYSKAIAAYEYTLVSRESAFDRWIRAGPGSTLISDSARRGARLFVSKAGCLECHNTPLLSDNQFHNIGVPQVGVGVPTEADCNLATVATVKSSCFALGRYQGLNILETQTLLKTPNNPYSDNPSDQSRLKYYEVQPDPSMMGSWRTPGLRDVALTAPYMHNGVYRTLEDVIWHYNNGGTTAGVAPSEMAKQIRPLGLTDTEINDLVAFLGTLTGDPLPCAITMDPTPGASTCTGGGVPPLPLGQGEWK